ncbi:MAG: DUF5615 family PIN-like protein [Ignavibacteriota bacterium]
MKLLFDQNISPKLIDNLGNLYPDCIHVLSVGLDKSSDSEIWLYAKVNDLIIVTKDADFAEKSLLFGFPPFVIWMRQGNCTTLEIENILKKNFDLISNFKTSAVAGLLNLY